MHQIESNSPQNFQKWRGVGGGGARTADISSSSSSEEEETGS